MIYDHRLYYYDLFMLTVKKKMFLTIFDFLSELINKISQFLTRLEIYL